MFASRHKEIALLKCNNNIWNLCHQIQGILSIVKTKFKVFLMSKKESWYLPIYLTASDVSTQIGFRHFGCLQLWIAKLKRTWIQLFRSGRPAGHRFCLDKLSENSERNIFGGFKQCFSIVYYFCHPKTAWWCDVIFRVTASWIYMNLRL